MAHQLNLYSPILLAPRRYFSAVAMAQALGLFAVALAALCGWVSLSASALKRDLQGSMQAQIAERDRLAQAVAATPAAGGPALAQELAAAEQLLAGRRALLEELGRGRLVDGRSHAAMLRMVAQTVPVPVWLTDIRLVDGRLELTGLTLDPDALRPWLAKLARHPLTAEQHLAAIRLERVGATAAPGAAVLPAGTQAWSFRLVSQLPGLPAADTVLAGVTP